MGGGVSVNNNATLQLQGGVSFSGGQGLGLVGQGSGSNNGALESPRGPVFQGSLQGKVPGLQRFTASTANFAHL